MQYAEYKGFQYQPEILEDEDTRKYIHDVFHDGVCIGQINKSQWYCAKFDEFKAFVDQYIEEHK